MLWFGSGSIFGPLWGAGVMPIKAKIFCAALVFAAAFLAPNQARAQAECPAFPKLQFWGDLTHGSVRAYIEERFGGDWNAYINKLERIKTGLQGIHGRGKGAVIKLKGRRVKLKGAKLGDYLQLSGVRLGVVRCLAEEAEADSLQNFATAAGGNDEKAATNFPKPEAKRQGYQTYVTLPQNLVEKLRQQAERRSLLENRKVSVNYIIVRSLKSRFLRDTD